MTVVFSFGCWFLIPYSFETAYFLNDEDKIIMRQRAELAEPYSGGNGHFRWQNLMLAMTDSKTYVSGICQLTSITVLYGELCTSPQPIMIFSRH